LAEGYTDYDEDKCVTTLSDAFNYFFMIEIAFGAIRLAVLLKSNYRLGKKFAIAIWFRDAMAMVTTFLSNYDIFGDCLVLFITERIANDTQDEDLLWLASMMRIFLWASIGPRLLALPWFLVAMISSMIFYRKQEFMLIA